MKSVPPERLAELYAMSPGQIFHYLVVVYGEKLANEVAVGLLQNEGLPAVTWPRIE